MCQLEEQNWRVGAAKVLNQVVRPLRDKIRVLSSHAAAAHSVTGPVPHTRGCMGPDTRCGRGVCLQCPCLPTVLRSEAAETLLGLYTAQRGLELVRLEWKALPHLPQTRVPCFSSRTTFDGDESLPTLTRHTLSPRASIPGLHGDRFIPTLHTTRPPAMSPLPAPHTILTRTGQNN